MIQFVGIYRLGLAVVVWGMIPALPAAAIPPPPPELKELFDAGRVRFVFYDPVEQPRERPGLTQFHAVYRWDFRFQVRTRREQGQLRVAALVKITQIEVELEHEVYLPEAYDTDALWQRSLVVHEFDHVAISTDPRPRLLVEHLARKLTLVERRVPAGQAIDEAWVRDVINEELNRRKEAVRDVIEFNNRRLDAQTSYGTRAVADRKQFFTTLFTRANLQEAEFPYLSEVADLIRRPDYQQPDLARKKALRPGPRTGTGDTADH